MVFCSCLALLYCWFKKTRSPLRGSDTPFACSDITATYL
nr:MAG TPA: hypothetical protein [Caudoviricetes sp.]